ncbi:hypothetical protein DFH08DRAFT_825654 [Mycena albidolilacea]|uniref:Uncharacterized protein n=1 Tax=Mycena albidolilacea TaxID=1033008 RepID=A0AAD6Z222_9AGAR|nr:hypothetical protein DFH08DRAFT_825654 [Mycena albidolilacea]
MGLSVREVENVPETDSERRRAKLGTNTRNRVLQATEPVRVVPNPSRTRFERDGEDMKCLPAYWRNGSSIGSARCSLGPSSTNRLVSSIRLAATFARDSLAHRVTGYGVCGIVLAIFHRTPDINLNTEPADLPVLSVISSRKSVMCHLQLRKIITPPLDICNVHGTGSLLALRGTELTRVPASQRLPRDLLADTRGFPGWIIGIRGINRRSPTPNATNFVVPRDHTASGKASLGNSPGLSPI